MSVLKKAEQFRAESKHDSAFAMAQSVIETAQNISSDQFLTRAYIELSTIYIETRKLDFAREACNKAIFFSEKADRADLKMDALYNIGMIYEKNGDIDSALYYYKKVESFRRQDSDTMRLGITLSGIASIYRKKNELQKAIDTNKESAYMYLASGKFDYLANRYFNIGEYYLIYDYNDSIDRMPYLLDSAEFFYQKCLNLSDSLELSAPAYRALRGLAVARARRGNYKEALNYMYRSANITQNLYSADVDNKLLELREQYNTANLELEAEQAKNDVLRIERNRNILIIITAAVIVIFVIWLYILEQKRKNLKAIAEKNDEINKQRIDELLQQQEISSLQGVLEGQEKERKRVAIDLHDRLGGILSMVKLHFSSVEEKLPDDNPEKKKFLTASELLDLATGEVRNISHDLLSGVLAKFGLIPALKDLTSRINESGEIKLNLIYKGVEEVLTGEQELQIYRITQGMISNILKHSEAKEATIQLLKNENENSVNLFMEDDGQGFNLEENKSDGIGLSNLKARVEKLKGDLHIDSCRGVGTSISIDIPIEND